MKHTETFYVKHNDRYFEPVTFHEYVPQDDTYIVRRVLHRGDHQMNFIKAKRHHIYLNA